MRKKHEYQLARDMIVRHVAEGGYQVGDKLPSRPKLAELLDTGLISVQQAVKTLEKEGVLYNIKGSGCFLKAVPTVDAPRQTPRSPFDAEMLFGHASPSTGKLTLRFAIFPGELDFFGDAWKRVIADFERKSHGVSIETIPTGSMEELQEGLRRAEIDVFQLPLPHLPIMIKSGLVMQPGLELDANSFFKPIYDASCHDGAPWGVPLAMGCCCMFYNRRWESLVRAATEGGGFWNFLEKLEKTPLPTGLEAFVANNHVLDELFRLDSATLNPGDIDLDASIDSPEFPEFIMRLDKHYRNPKIFHPMVNEGGEDSIHSFAAGRVAMALGNSSWMSIFHRLHARSWEIAEEPHEAGTSQKTTGVIYSASSLTCHPEESLALLRHLGSVDAQRAFALKGLPVANQTACAELRLDGQEPSSKDRIISILESGHIPTMDANGSNEFLERVLRPESGRWRSGKITACQFLDSIQRKREIFLNRRQAKP